MRGGAVVRWIQIEECVRSIPVPYAPAKVDMVNVDIPESRRDFIKLCECGPEGDGMLADLPAAASVSFEAPTFLGVAEER